MDYIRVRMNVRRESEVALGDGAMRTLGNDAMSDTDDHRWDLSQSDKGYLPECDEVWERKFEEWQARDWPDWLAKHLKFPFTVTREEDEDDAYFAPGAARGPFRLGHKMDVLELGEEDIDRGVMARVREKGRIGCVPLCDVEVRPKTDGNSWPVREYVVWFANRY
jgi:calcium binding protein